MSYQPPPEGPSGDKPPDEQAPDSPPAQPDPSPTINMGDATQVQPPQGGYTSPTSQGGYAPPPPSGYTPPPTGGGGYSPPPMGGGGYGGPGAPGGMPPAPPSAAGAGGFSPADLQSLLQSWINAVTKPSAMTFEGELRNATWVKVLIGVAAVAIVSFLVSLIFAAAASASIDSAFDQMQNSFSQQGRSVDLKGYRDLARFFVGGGGAFVALVSPFITFFLGAGWLYLMARLFRGQDSDFLSHSYVLSIGYAPLRIVSRIIGIIPILGGLVAFALWVYQVVLSGFALQASHRMTAGRAQMAVWISYIVLIALSCVCFLLFIVVIVGALSRSQ